MKSIIINVMPEETRMALIDNQELIAVELERPQHTHLVGNIYKGHVQNVLKGMQAAFVDIGQSKNAFLYVGDGKTPNAGGLESQQPKIHIGQSLPIQITKDASGLKGPRATTHLSIPGRNVVLMPASSGYVGISHRIEDEAERKRLHDIVTELKPEGMGMIIRTAAIGQKREAIEQDIKYLAKIWSAITAKAKLKDGPGLLYRDADLAIRIVRDSFTDDVDEMVIDDERVYRRAVELAESFNPELAKRIHLYKGNVSIFNSYHIDEELKKLESPVVELKSGGFLVIDKTEAMTVIDVNTGKFVGNANLGETVYRMNLEAADEIMKQLRLRDIGGIILVDFIDMEKESQKEDLLLRMRAQAQKDRTKTNIVDITALGLVEITRKKSRPNVDAMLYATCSACNGTGRVESSETIGIRICREIRRLEKKHHNQDGYELQLNPAVADDLKLADTLGPLSKELGIELEIVSHPEMGHSSFVISGR